MESFDDYLIMLRAVGVHGRGALASEREWTDEVVPAVDVVVCVQRAEGLGRRGEEGFGREVVRVEDGGVVAEAEEAAVEEGADVGEHEEEEGEEEGGEGGEEGEGHFFGVCMVRGGDDVMWSGGGGEGGDREGGGVTGVLR